jgi:hypothetical protein
MLLAGSRDERGQRGARSRYERVGHRAGGGGDDSPMAVCVKNSREISRIPRGKTLLY